jgi:hypothetical protein
MDDVEAVRLLKERGYTLGDSAVREDGVFLWKVNETFMFRRDVVDLASGACILSDVIDRNEGKVFPNAPCLASSYLLFQDRMFQELRDLEEIQKRQRVEHLVKGANARGFSVNDLLLELDSGRGIDGIFQLLKRGRTGH